MPRTKITAEKHRRLNWSSSIVNKQFRNALTVSGKWVAATDIDLVIYTRKGPAFVLEQKNMKTWLEQTGHVDISKVQIDVLLDVCSQLKPKPTLLLIIYDALEIEKLGKKAKIYGKVITQESLKDVKITGKPRQYKFTKSMFFSETLNKLIDYCNETISGPQWAELPDLVKFV